VYSAASVYRTSCLHPALICLSLPLTRLVLATQVRLKLETPLFVMDALLEAAKQLLANELATAEEEAEAVSMVRLIPSICDSRTVSVDMGHAD